YSTTPPPPTPTLFPYTTLFRSGFGVDRDGLVVQRVEEHFAAGVNRAAIDCIAACHPLRGGGGLGLKLPFQRAARLGKVERVKDIDRKSTRLNSSHVKISYAVFC